MWFFDEAEAAVEPQRAQVVGLGVDERASSVAATEPLQRVGHERGAQSGAGMGWVDGEALQVARVGGATAHGVSDRSLIGGVERDAVPNRRRGAERLGEAGVVESPEVVESGGVDVEHACAIGPPGAAAGQHAARCL